MVKLFYVDKRGASICKYFPTAKDAHPTMAKLRMEAELKDETGRKIGAVEYAPRVCDDRRVKWLWWAE